MNSIFSTLKHYYNGFWLNQSVGNNAFSFEKRKHKKIYVAAFQEGNVGQLKKGEHIVFSEFHNNIEHNVLGLNRFIFFFLNKIPVYIFDNHNHAFFCWYVASLYDVIPAHCRLVHIDQHKDMRTPSEDFIHPIDKSHLQIAFEYTNFTLNVGNFIQPALRLKMFEGVDIIDDSSSLSYKPDSNFILDIDVDFFSDEMAYLDHQLKLDVIRRLIPHASCITIATSPYFIDQSRAIDMVHQFFL